MFSFRKVKFNFKFKIMLSEAILDVLLKKYFKVKKWLNPQVVLQSINREQDL